MFDKEMKTAISKAIKLGIDNGFDVEKSVLETLDLAEKGELDNFKSNSAPIVKTLEFKSAEVDLENRIVSGYAATWDLDQVDDIIHRGAFKKSISERFPANKIKLLSQHSTLIGKPIEMYEDEKGLFVRAYISKTAQGDNDLQLVKDGVLDRFSIGFSIPGGKYEIDEKGIRHIYEVKLFEFSLVTFPANEQAHVIGAKNAFEDQVRKAQEEIDKQNAEGDDVEEEDNSELEKSLQDFIDFTKNLNSKKDEYDVLEKSLKEFADFAKSKKY